MSRRPLLQEGTITNSSVARPDRGGEALLRGASAVLEPLEWETDSLEDGARLFLDADHTFAELPEALSGKSFIRSSFFGTRKVCRQPGIAFAITPARGQGRPSRADQLERMAFRQVRVPAIRVFSDGTAVDCSVYQKQMREGERIDIGSPGLVLTADAPWCVLVAAAHTSAGKTGDHAGYGRGDGSSSDQRVRNPFSPPLAQNYTIAAEVPDHVGYFIHDPGMARLPSGHFLVAAPCWQRGVGPDHLMMSRSVDGGRSWQRLPDLPFAEGTPFVVGNKLYMFTQPRQHQDVYFMRSDDEGETWSDPAMVFEGAFWNCQTSMVIRGGQLYWVLDQKHKATVAIAADLSQDLLDSSAWRVSQVIPATQTAVQFRTAHDHHQPERFDDWNLEGNVMDVNGHLRIACRVNPKHTGTTPGIAAVFDLEDDGANLNLQFDQHYPWPGGQTKFCIVYDERTRLFWMASNIVSGAHPQKLGGGPDGERRFLMLYCGMDGLNWLPVGCIAMAPCSSQSFMYPSMVVDGDDLAILSRSGRKSGHYHDADLATFHRVHNFRELAWH